MKHGHHLAVSAPLRPGLALLAAALVAGCAVGTRGGGATMTLGRPAMGTVLEITVVAVDRAAAQAAAEAAFAAVAATDDLLTTWRSDGALERLNTAAGHGPVAISDELYRALATMLRLAVDTDGAFDVATAGAARAWSRADMVDSGAAAPARLHEVLTLGDATATLAAGARLDAGGVGKGMGLDAAAAALRAHRVRSAFIDFGGSSQLALGTPTDRPSGWPVVVSGLAEGSVTGALSLRDRALSTSRATGPGYEGGPILDPEGGRPIETARQASVLAASATDADAWSTALVVLGRPGLEAARRAGVEALLMDADGTAATPGFPLVPASIDIIVGPTR